MLLKGNIRGGAILLANHLTNTRDNDEVEMMRMQGFSGENLADALKDIEVISNTATRCKKPFFTLVLSPPAFAVLEDKHIISATERALKALKLDKQACCLIRHTKHNRTHYHVVVSRIDVDTMKAIELGLYKKDLHRLSKSLYQAHGWELPKGMQQGRKAKTSNYTLAEEQQAKRLGQTPQALKASIKTCWDESSTREAFEAKLKSCGCMLAKGDRRGLVAVSVDGQIIALNKRNLGEPVKAIRTKLGHLDTAPSIKDVQGQMNEQSQQQHKHAYQQARLILAKQQQAKRQPLKAQKQALLHEHKQAREALYEKQQTRRLQEQQQRQKRMRKGVLGLWDRVTGKTKLIKARNEAEAKACQLRDEKERYQQRVQQHQALQEVQQQLERLRDQHEKDIMLFNAQWLDQKQTTTLVNALEANQQQQRTSNQQELGL